MNNNEIIVDSTNAYLHEIYDINLLTWEDEQRLGEGVLNGDKEARNKLVEANLRLVVCHSQDQRERHGTRPEPQGYR